MNHKILPMTLAILLVSSALLMACQPTPTAPPAPPTAVPAATNQSSNPDKNLLAISTGEWAPFSGEKLYENGFVLHVIREAFAREGLQVRFDFFPWERAYQSMLDQGSPYAASAYWYQSAERESVCFYSEPIIEEEMVLFYRKAAPLENWSTLEDLKGYTIGTSIGITYPDEFKKLIESGVLTAEEAPDDELNFKKLLLGRIDLFPTTSVAGLELLRNKFTPAELDQLDYHKKPLLVSTGHLLFSKSHPDGEKNLAIFNSGLEKIIKDGTYEKMYADLLAGKYSK